MQLKSLEIFGFKSFADKTKFIFDKGITGVVGPNGCGKSNIVDAMRWVLGEQKTSSLRSDKMENIIFNGTKKRKKANFAQVSLTFDNTKNILPTEYTTVTISRKYYRNGDGGYSLNGVACRRKDILNLFLDTGVGPDSYAIIELKMVDEILNDKNDSRRVLFEEAAGISKYKIRKKQTFKKLKDTQADLERVEDILFEIEKNLKALESQARKAKRYFDMKAEYKDISSQHSFFKIRHLRDSFDSIEKEEQAISDQMLAFQTQITQHEVRIEELKKEQLDNEKILAEAQRELNLHVENIQNIETEKSIKNERLKYLQQRELAITEQIETEKQLRIRTREELEQVSQQLLTKKEEFSAQEKRLEVVRQGMDALRKTNDELKNTVDEASTNHRNTEQKLHQSKKDKEIKQIQIQSLKSEMRRSEDDQSSRNDELETFADRLKSLGEETGTLGSEVETLRSQKTQNDDDVELVSTNINELKDKIYQTSRGLDARRNEVGLIKDLVENLEGFPESVKFLKKEANWVKNAPLVSDIFYAAEPFKVAFENLLEPFLSYYVVPSRTDAMAAIKLLSNASKGRANFFILDELEKYVPRSVDQFAHSNPAIGSVEFSSEYRKLAEFLLDKVYIVDDEAHLPENAPEDLVFITRAGNYSSRKYSLSGGSIGLFQGKRLGRAKNLEKIEKEIRSRETELNEQKAQLDILEKRLETLKLENYNQELDEKNNIYQEKKEQLSILTTREEEYREFIQQAGQRVENILFEIDSIDKSLVEIIPEIAELETLFAEQTGVLEGLRGQLDASNAEVSEKGQIYNQQNISLIQLKNLVENLSREETQKTDRISQLNDNEERLQGDLEITRGDIHQLVQNNLQNDEEIVALYEEKKVKEQKTDKFEQVAAHIRDTITGQEDLIRSERKEREEVEVRRDAIKEKVTEIKIQLNSLKERMEVEFEVDISGLDPETLFEKGIDKYDPEKIEEKMYKLRNRLQNYGEINPMAVEAYNEMKERYDFIHQEKEDLDEARQNLLKTIEEIDNEATTKFLESFHAVRENFIKVFQSLFSDGDTCDLELEDLENPLDSKIRITARPKGKRPLTINQLSGGEKTLTAISLLFAIYLLKPAPFCIFDEVDAPLDDANIDKFNNIIRDFSKESQFIIVTHNKRTMSSTNVMYGVTMQESGISKVLPVDLLALNLN